jgi:hypothetical protein
MTREYTTFDLVDSLVAGQSTGPSELKDSVFRQR